MIEEQYADRNPTRRWEGHIRKNRKSIATGAKREAGALSSCPTPLARNMPSVEVSWGELIDKITILEIKERRLVSPKAVSNVRNELARLTLVLPDSPSRPAKLDELKKKLKSINEALWEIEDQIRAKEAVKSFDQHFIELARSIYFNNDKRARIKREINELLNSEFVEEKQYTPYAP